MFADGSRWDASPTVRDNLLTISGPVGLNFESTPGEISIRNTGNRLYRVRPGLAPDLVSQPFVPGLQVADGRVLAIIGGNISLEGGVITGIDSHIHLGSVRAGTVRFSPDRPGWNFDYGGAGSLGDISLSNLALVNALGQGSGSIVLHARDISLRSGSVIGVQNLGNAAWQRLTLEAAGTLSIEGTGINANGPRFGQVRSAVFSETLGNGNGAGISIRTGNLNIENGGLIGSSTFGGGRSGAIDISADTIRAREIASFGGFSGIATQTVGTGAGGDIVISTGDLNLENGGGLGTTSYTAAPSGNLRINASRSVRVTGSSANTFSFTASNIVSLAIGKGKSGDITIVTPDLSITGGASVSSATFGEGAGGNVYIDARSLELIDRPGSPLGNSLSASTLGAGNAGNLTILAETLRVLGGSGIQSSTFAGGNGGSISIEATSIEVDANSAIESGALTLSPELANFYGLTVPPTGKSGDLSIRTESLSITGNGRVSVLNLGSNDAGSIGIETTSLSLTDGGSLTASTLNGEGGNIIVRSRDSFLSNGNITASVAGTGNGGNIFLNSRTLLLLDNSRIQANAVAGNGGNIAISGRGILRDSSSSITADSDLGIEGTVNISAVEENPRSLPTFDIALAVPADPVTGACLDPDLAPSTLQIAPPPLAPGPDAPLPFIFDARVETGRESSLPANQIAIGPDGRVTAVLTLDRERVESGDCPR